MGVTARRPSAGQRLSPDQPAGGPRRPRAAERVGLALILAAVVLFGAFPGTAPAVHRGGDLPPLYDRTYKCDALELLPSPPELVVFGGSRAQRFEPSYAEALTGLESFNFALQNSRPEDVYAIARYLFWRSPVTKLRCVWAVQVTTFGDNPFHPGLLAEERLRQFVPDHLLAQQSALDAKVVGHEIQWTDEYSGRGCLLRNSYDAKVDRGIDFDTLLGVYLERMLPRAAAPNPHGVERSRYYFERTLRLFNLHGVAPVIVVMPYHPEALAAFRAVGWQTKLDDLTSYLDGLEDRYRVHVVDYTEIEAFGGTPEGFYDGSHIKSVNARRILDQIVEDVPGAFR